MALTDALSSIAGTASNWGSTPSSGGKQQQSQSSAYQAANQAAKKIADAIKASSGKQGDSGATGSLDSEMNPVSYKKGGPVKKTGLAKLHKGERVLTVKQAKKYGRKK